MNFGSKLFTGMVLLLWAAGRGWGRPRLCTARLFLRARLGRLGRLRGGLVRLLVEGAYVPGQREDLRVRDLALEGKHGRAGHSFADDLGDVLDRAAMLPGAVHEVEKLER